MNEQEKMNYSRVANAIDYIRQNFRDQPNLNEVAEKVHLSSFHFQKLFSEWAGTTPKKFLQFVSVEYAKRLLKESRATLFETAFETGLSGTSRLHDLFVNIEGMTPAEYKNGGQDLSINYSFADSPFGRVIVASTRKGICYMAFEDDEQIAFEKLTLKFPSAHFDKKTDILQQNALCIFKNDWSSLPQIKLHLKGTDFQLKVWEALLKIPMGRLSTYGSIAQKIEAPTASRAVGTAIGSNPVAFLIPCHRVIQSTGIFGGYMWGSTRKTAIIGWEGAKVNVESIS
ncbi:AraC family transcriptional regulator of adaptative response/methylated-DNA-[protein]-cysteine methyltransferase [Arcticibacter tournemirensis]|uniref:methylated-DNA--[protein]-cysteine S-methyltransferase n=1 Tax=Arcticibacter tournemirensis TaxID=699437 RepID=A0A5M9H211_9SPHI|nr:methylated-DNA--[protein]-cysteine S-methyltransferase [Arcticibacter tournemirensis]KAA8479174.1 methylated-DNA--[protein]-cysteine S-methyltransferase [Arcticibacter tournemirensis]TQM48473.1 AraC family transcriptional regulator of adaptative response/methylated-DNA-[protein]-cysteine methyltransferase [Arcticibacter tournemirensis]